MEKTRIIGWIIFALIGIAVVLKIADAIAPGSKVQITGIRPSEKLHEELISVDEARHGKEYENYYIIEPEYSQPFYAGVNGKSLFDGFSYSSDKNSHWLTKYELKEMIKVE